MKSNFNKEINLFVDKINMNVKLKSERVIELEESISHLEECELYIEKVSENLYKILNEIFQDEDEIIFCINIYKESDKYYYLPLKLRRYLKKKDKINMISSLNENEIIEHYYINTRYNNVKIKKLISEIVKKDLGNRIEGLETSFIINKRCSVAVVLYDDRYIFIEY
ncbi:hypothetical protein PMY12_08540 [Clostridium tertium]|uniref:DUF3885 domain-containing protein n=1 Tax=Clostridium tertium TaxID=1559 RepID=UPI0023300102|nr:hypothetical protein [Clostridium tertium]MDB1934065.1 hypothetical protein [Clostridium tertium]MDB1937060.1 hypothetical protein [Clostridium tertium]